MKRDRLSEYLTSTAMDSRTESRLLRMAISRGFLQWEDLDAVADRLPDRQDGRDSTQPGARWVHALLDAGRLDPRVLADLSAELERGRDDLTPELTARPVSLGTSPRQLELRTTELPLTDSSSPHLSSRTSRIDPATLPVELRFLSSWERYRVERFLGAGGMGTVYRAFDPFLDRWVALKFLHWNETSQVGRFINEARSQARVDHPNVCRVYEVGEVEERPYIAMQYIEGRSLSDVRDELPAEAKVRLVRDVARAVHAAHRNGLIHRDLKPGNILVGTDDSGALHPFVVDFGLARDQDEDGLTRSGMLSGTPAYLSPEQAQGLPLDRRTDVYSLGVVLYETLGGRPPFLAANAAGILVRLVQEEAEPLRKLQPQVPPDLETVVMKCLEKDPAQRYDSARALAEDLDRYLEGEPVHARPASWAYRLGKKARKNKALTAVAAAATIALLVLGGVALRAEWQARERAALAQGFGQRVKDLEYRIRIEAFLAPHDIRAHKQQVRREAEAIRAEMARLGPLAAGPGHYALGKGYLALHEYETALDHLERAWQAGQRTPEVASALGRTLQVLYQKALWDAAREQNVDARRAAREESERTFSRPALSYLREIPAEETSRQPYLAALRAFFEERYPEALAKAREAYRRDVAFYEAAQLEADSLMAQGNQEGSAGRYEEALRFYDQAGETFRALLANVRSDAALYAADCNRRILRLDARMAVGGLSEAEVLDAAAACDRALQVDPELGEAFTSKARLYQRWGQHQLQSGEDPTPALSDARAMAERAIALNPQDAQAYSHMAVAMRILAAWEQSHGRAPGSHLEQAVQAAAKAVELQPQRATFRNNLATIYLKLAEVQMGSGLDAGAAIRSGIANADQATRLDTRFGLAYINLGSAWKTMAEYQISRGDDPTESTSRGVEAFEYAIRLNPNSAPAYNNLGNAHLTLGDYQMARGAAARPSLERAIASYRKAVEVRPDYEVAIFNLAWTQRLLALDQLQRGEDPAPSLAAARETLGRIATDADVLLERARCDVIAARWAMRQGRESGPLLRQASSTLEQARDLNPQQADIYMEGALAARYQAEQDLKKGGRPAAAVRDGLTRIEKALEINAQEARYLAEQGVLQTLAARLETDPARRRQEESRAAATLGKALEANPLLRREYGPWLEGGRI
ncbi:MAG TPA: protein kinase [Thermoanaerobaculia bacterium]|nr:protein kinase [Thermoanaerobaculia bacterium]